MNLQTSKVQNNEGEGAQMTSRKARKGKKPTHKQLEDKKFQPAEEASASSPGPGRGTHPLPSYEDAETESEDNQVKDE